MEPESSANGSKNDDNEPADVPGLIALDEYRSPEGPTVSRLEIWYQTLRQKFLRRKSSVSVDEDELLRTDIETLRDFVAEPDCRFVIETLTREYSAWLQAESVQSNLRVLVMPPCDYRDHLKLWAENEDLHQLEPPDRKHLLRGDTYRIEGLSKNRPVLVAPLQSWFLRHQDGLQHIRLLLKSLHETDCRCLVSCNSWTWSYLKTALGADLILPAPESLAPYDAQSLGIWLNDLSTAQNTSAVRFRDRDDGSEVLEPDKDGNHEHEILKRLADRSGGIPWVAWRLWRRSLRTQSEARQEKAGDSEDAEQENEQAADNGTRQKTSDDDTDEDNRKVFWVVNEKPLTLPKGHESASRLVLHALLIHGELSIDELRLVLPESGQDALVPALQRSGFIERGDRGYRCSTPAYPAIRASMADAGMPIAAI